MIIIIRSTNTQIVKKRLYLFVFISEKIDHFINSSLLQEPRKIMININMFTELRSECPK